MVGIWHFKTKTAAAMMLFILYMYSLIKQHDLPEQPRGQKQSLSHAVAPL